MGAGEFLTGHFKSFYSKHTASVPAVGSREFGIGEFGKKISRRHISFASDSELNSFLHERSPLFISYSTAYYERPASSPMSSKGFLGADIVYEFDADDVKTECKQEHDSWSCPKCGAEGKGAIDACPTCGAHVKKDEWYCPSCLEETKKQTFRLINFLENDFSLGGEISVNFSGNAGYHIHLRGDAVRSLNKEARIELLDYLTAKDMDFSKLGFAESGKSGKMFLCPFEAETSGWGKRLLSSLIKLLEEGDVEKIAAFGAITNKKAKDLIENKKLVLKTIREKGILFSIAGRKNTQFWESVLSHLVNESALDVDRQTSADINKIIRVPETLHGGTGLLAKNVSIDALKEFKPLRDSVVFSDSRVKVFINKSPKFYLKGNEFGPFENEEVELPLYAAIYLVARRSADLAGV
ncbi:MAG: DNA primase small subunit domain-containing protein [archaeon]|jgi:DNA primase small subunit|nr:DNA primase small subunit domain-containing protein [archaeon]